MNSDIRLMLNAQCLELGSAAVSPTNRRDQ